MARKLVYGIGLYAAGEFVSKADGKFTKEYDLWKGMLRRCYSKKYQDRRSTYVGCSVSEDFKSFQSFARWASVQIGFGTANWHLDKDIICKGNRVYSADTCVFVPSQVNALLTGPRTNSGEWPIGVCFLKQTGKYQVNCGNGSTPSRATYLGSFPTPESAFERYKEVKEAYIKQRAEEFKHQIDPRAYAALMAYEILITD